jgi:hypothetical protein
MGKVLDDVLERLATTRGSAIGLTVAEVEGLVHEIGDVVAERDRWAARIKTLEGRLTSIVEIASGVEPRKR